MPLVAIIILVVIIVALILYNMSIHKKIETFNNINSQITSLNVLQDFMNTLSEISTAEEKLKKINGILIEKYNIRYSTIVVYDGAEYVIKASNVAEKHWETLKNLQSEKEFKESIETATPKYITIEREGERLPYQKMEFARAKSAMFFPLYIDNVYIGYWIIEGGTPHEFDNMDTTILEVVKNNIIAVLKTVQNQTVIENIVRDDLYSELKSAEYLYGKAKKKIDQYTTSTVCLFKIVNLVKINESISRKTGNKIITEVARVVKQELAPEYVFVRYMGPKFAIAFSGVDLYSVTEFLENLKNRIEGIQIEAESKTKSKAKPIISPVKPKTNFVVASYYKGTGIEEVTKKLEEYLDNSEKTESAITTI